VVFITLTIEARALACEYMQRSGAHLITVEAIENRIHVVRGLKVMLDRDLATLYQVSTKRLNEQVKRNIDRFPPDFMFQLTDKEAVALRSQSATSKTGRGGRRYLPYVFTEHGALMLASVLNSAIAVDISIQIVRAFVRLRELIASHKELAHKLEELEREYDARFKVVFEVLDQLMGPAEEFDRPPIGFAA
jgi:predicted DNA binding protein